MRIATAVGAISVGSAACPPSSALGLFVPGMRPNTSTSASGMPSAVMGAPGSRRNSFASTAVIFPSIFLAPSVHLLAGQRDERVVEAGLVHAQVPGDDL